MSNEPVNSNDLKPPEEPLPRGEMYVFDPDKFDKETSREVSEMKRWMKGRGRGEDDMSFQENVQKVVRDRARERSWGEKYSGKVVKSWGDPDTGAPWHHMMDDMDSGRPFTTSEIEALIEYPVWHVPFALGQSRQLSPEQIKLLASQPTLPGWKFQRTIVDAQSAWGADPAVLEEAVVINKSANPLPRS